MWNTPTKQQLDRIPRLYETEHIPAEEKTIHLHFFMGANDWFIVEYDGDDLFFGFAILNGDYEMAEWGYISFSELKSIRVHGLEIDCDTSWTPTKARDIDLIKRCLTFCPQPLLPSSSIVAREPAFPVKAMDSFMLTLPAHTIDRRLQPSA